MRAAILFVSSLIPADHSSIVTISILASAVVLTFVGSFFKSKCSSITLECGVLYKPDTHIWGLLYLQIVGGNSAAYAYTLIGLAFLQFVVLIIFNVFSILQKSLKVIPYLDVCMRRHVEDDWELFEQAAFLRERESKSEEEDSEGSGSMESLPTY